MATKKLSVTMDEELVAEIQRRSKNVSALITDAVEAYLRNVHLGELLDELDQEFGPVPQDVMDQVRHDWAVAVGRVEQAGRATGASSADSR